MDYIKISEKYKPKEIDILLIGEAPPPNRKKYFYKVPSNYKPSSKPIENDSSLPSTIFNHFFNKRPSNSNEYQSFLENLKAKRIFLIDILNEPIKIRNNKNNEQKLFTDENLKKLKTRVEKLSTDKTIVIFLLARNYRKFFLDKLKTIFPNAIFIKWKNFRMNTPHNTIYSA